MFSLGWGEGGEA